MYHAQIHVPLLCVVFTHFGGGGNATGHERHEVTRVWRPAGGTGDDVTRWGNRWMGGVAGNYLHVHNYWEFCFREFVDC